MGKIYIVGLGPGNIDSLTLGAINRINSGEKNFLRTEKHPTIKYFLDNDISFKSYDYAYEEEDFEKIYKSIVDDLIKKANEYGSINYFVPGNPLVAERTVEILMSKDIDVEIVSGMSFIEPMIELVARDPVNGLKIVDGAVFDQAMIDINVDIIITQVYNKRILSNIKLILSDIYGDEYRVLVVHNAGIDSLEEMQNIPIYMLDRIDEIGYLTSIYIPKIEEKDRKVFDFYDLVGIIRLLRSADGCPWDIEQTHKSIRASVIEEAYEVVDAIDRKHSDDLAEELGDLLLQVLLHSQIAHEEGEFSIIDVTSTLANKLIYRHPHVFSEKKLENTNQVVYNWDKLKDSQRKFKSKTEKLKNLASFPALVKSFKIQDIAASVGFDWMDIQGPLDKIIEEYQEVLDAIKEFGKNHENVEGELGDLLFAVVNLARFLNVDPEVALNITNKKFVDRFEFMEKESLNSHKKLIDMTLEEMEELWTLAKKELSE